MNQYHHCNVIIDKGSKVVSSLEPFLIKILYELHILSMQFYILQSIILCLIALKLQMNYEASDYTFSHCFHAISFILCQNILLSSHTSSLIMKTKCHMQKYQVKL